jgi:hypothetical protein
MKKVQVQQIQPDPPGGPTFGQVSNPADFMKSQIFAHQHTEAMARDFVIGVCSTRAVAGFDISLLGGMQVRILAPGQVVDDDGKSYELIGAASVDNTLDPSDATLRRIDLIVAVLEADVDAAAELRPFVRLRTQAELDASISPYPPQQFNQPTEQHTRATISVKVGTPAANPVAPEASPDEESLYSIEIPANSSQIVASNVTDLRHKVASNCELQDRLNSLRLEIISLPPPRHRHKSDEVDNAVGSPSYEKLGTTVQDALDKLALAQTPPPDPGGGATGAALRPEILRPDLVPYHAQSGKLTSSGAVIDGVPSIRIPLPRSIQFPTGVFSVNDNAFDDKSLHPRIINDDPQPSNSTQHEELLSVNNVTVTATDGGGDWTNLNAPVPVPASSYFYGRRAVARDGQFIEIFGGSHIGDSSWFTFDTIAKTYEARAFSGAVPVYPIMFASPCGSNKALLMTLDNNEDSSNPGRRHWFLVDLISGASQEITDGPGAATDPLSLSAVDAIGDLIETNVVMIIVAYSTGVSSLGYKYYFFHADNSTFEVFAPVGAFLSGNRGLTGAHFCFYQQGQALYFQDERAQVGNEQAKTAIFNYATRSFTTLSVAPPQNPASIQQFLPGAEMANINGKPQIMFGWWNQSNTQWVSYVYQFTGGAAPEWRRLQTGLPGRWFSQLASTLQNGFPQGKGYFFGGQGENRQFSNDAWGFASGGIVASICSGTPGITLGPDTTAATIRLPDFQLPANFPVGHVRITLRGQNIEGRVRVLESFDDGAHLQEVPLDSNTAVLNTNNNPRRQLFLVLNGSRNIKPCISSTYEIFESTNGGGLGMLYLVFDCPPGVNYLNMNDKGRLTVVGAAAQTSRAKAILLEMTKNGINAPSTFDYINKPRIERKYEGGPQAAGVAPTVRFDFSVLPDFIQCWKVDAVGVAKLLQDCAVAFNGNITVNGLADGESFRVHLAG